MRGKRRASVYIQQNDGHVSWAERRMCTGEGARPLVVDGKEVPWHQCRLRDCKMERKVGR